MAMERLRTEGKVELKADVQKPFWWKLQGKKTLTWTICIPNSTALRDENHISLPKTLDEKKTNAVKKKNTGGI